LERLIILWKSIYTYWKLNDDENSRHITTMKYRIILTPTCIYNVILYLKSFHYNNLLHNSRLYIALNEMLILSWILGKDTEAWSSYVFEYYSENSVTRRNFSLHISWPVTHKYKPRPLPLHQIALCWFCLLVVCSRITWFHQTSVSRIDCRK